MDSYIVFESQLNLPGVTPVTFYNLNLPCTPSTSHMPGQVGYKPPVPDSLTTDVITPTKAGTCTPSHEAFKHAPSVVLAFGRLKRQTVTF